MTHVNYHKLKLPVAFDLVETPLIKHRYSDYFITHDPDRAGGWVVTLNPEWDEDEYDYRCTPLLICDSLVQAARYIEITTNPKMRVPGCNLRAL